VAFLLSLFTRERLVKALRERDPELNRQLKELEDGTLPDAAPQAAATAGDRGPDTSAEPAGSGILAQVEELARQGKLSTHMADQLKALQQTPGARGMLDALLRRLGNLFGKRPAGEEEE